MVRLLISRVLLIITFFFYKVQHCCVLTLYPYVVSLCLSLAFAAVLTHYRYFFVLYLAKLLGIASTMLKRSLRSELKQAFLFS